MNEAQLSLSNISFQYHQDRPLVIEDYSLEVKKGELVVISSPSGTGKTTIAQLLSGELRPQAGSIQVAAYQVDRLKGNRLAEYRRHAGFVFQQANLLSEKTIESNISFALELDRITGERAKASVKSVLDRFQLTDLADRYPHEVSSGERQRAAIARAVVREPLVLIADEPSAMLSESGELAVIQSLVRENQRGMTVLIFTNRLSLAKLIPQARHETFRPSISR